jgi:hypothetical protein
MEQFPWELDGALIRPTRLPFRNRSEAFTLQPFTKPW